MSQTRVVLRPNTESPHATHENLYCHDNPQFMPTARLHLAKLATLMLAHQTPRWRHPQILMGGTRLVTHTHYRIICHVNYQKNVTKHTAAYRAHRIAAAAAAYIALFLAGPSYATNLILSDSPTTAGNWYTGYVGLGFTTGSAAPTISQLGRYVFSGSTHTHTLALVQSSNNSVVASATLSTSGLGTGFAYVPLATPVTLSPNTTYYLVSSETAGGDDFYYNSPITVSSLVASVGGSAFGSSPASVGFSGVNGNVSYGPVDMATASDPPGAVEDEFVGPFSSWTNVKTAYGATGNGTTDDTVAIQNGLNALASGTISVLYFPAGTYKITSTLTLNWPTSGAGWGGMLIGHNPADTIISWAGSSGGTMMLVSEQFASKQARITWNGNGIAGVDVWQKTASGGFSENSWYYDNVYENAAIGIELGNPGVSAEDSLVTFLRCQFLNNTSVGQKINNPNTVDIFTYFSTFTNNAVGIANTSAQQGNFSVWYNVFSGSTTADIEGPAAEWYGLHGNYSIGSAQFLVLAPIGANASQWTVNNNTILDTTNAESIEITQPAEMLFVGNTVRTISGGAAPAVYMKPSGALGGGFIESFNNTFTVSSPVSVTGSGSNLTEYNDSIVSRSNINPTVPSYSTPPNTSRTIYEVAARSSAATIQAAINNAVAQQGNRPVVHLQAGYYNIASTISIPANLDVQIIGDGAHTDLIWTGTSGTGPMFEFHSPSKASIQDVKLDGNGNTVTNLIVVGTEDSAQARVQLWDIYDGNGNNCLKTNGLNHTTVNVYGYSCEFANGVVVAGPGTPVTGSVNFFGSLNNATGVVWNVTGQGNLLVEDTWYQGTATNLVNLSGAAGNLSIVGGVSGPDSATPVVTLTGYAGTFALLDWFTYPTANQWITVTSPSSSTNALFMNDYWDYASYWNVASGGNVAAYKNMMYQSTGAVTTPNKGVAPSNTFINSALTQMQTYFPTQNTSLPAGVTDVRIMNIWAVFGNTAILIETGI
jgi:Pectate lyase superfamily protein